MADQQPVAQDPTGGDQPGSAQQPQPQTPSGNQGDRSFTQAELNQIVQQRLTEAEERTRRKAETDARKQVETELKEQGKWQDLATERGTEIERLHPIEQQYTELAAVVQSIIKDRLEALPADLRKLLPASLPVKDQLEWVENAAKAAAKLHAGPPPPGNGANPRPAAPVDRAQRIEEDKKRARPAYAL